MYKLTFRLNLKNTKKRKRKNEKEKVQQKMSEWIITLLEMRIYNRLALRTRLKSGAWICQSRMRILRGWKKFGGNELYVFVSIHKAGRKERRFLEHFQNKRGWNIEHFNFCNFFNTVALLSTRVFGSSLRCCGLICQFGYQLKTGTPSGERFKIENLTWNTNITFMYRTMLNFCFRMLLDKMNEKVRGKN